MATDTRIGTSIKRARERKRWTQRQLADALGVDRKTVDNWENHRTSPRSSIGALEEVLGVSLTGQPDADPLAAAIIPENQWEYDVLNDEALPVDVRRALVLDWRRGRDEAWAAARREAARRQGSASVRTEGPGKAAS